MIRRLIGPDGNRGMAAVEFAFVLPVLLLMYLGGYQLSDALACSRKVTITARAVADLTSQYSSVSSGTVKSILNASQQILAPYAVSRAVVTITEIYTDPKAGTTSVVWSQANTASGVGLTIGSSYALPAKIATPGGYLLIGEVTYQYKPAIFYGIVGPLTLHEKIYMSPRVSSQVSWTL